MFSRVHILAGDILALARVYPQPALRFADVLINGPARVRASNWPSSQRAKECSPPCLCHIARTSNCQTIGGYSPSSVPVAAAELYKAENSCGPLCQSSVSIVKNGGIRMENFSPPVYKQFHLDLKCPLGFGRHNGTINQPVSPLSFFVPFSLCSALSFPLSCPLLSWRFSLPCFIAFIVFA